MGLFDRFRKKVKETPQDEGLLAEESSEEAEKAISERIELTKREDKTPIQDTAKEGVKMEDDEWDD